MAEEAVERQVPAARPTAGTGTVAHAGLKAIGTSEGLRELEPEPRSYFEAGGEGRRADVQ